MKFATCFNPPVKPVVVFDPDKKESQSVTHPEFKEECDMNEIVKRFKVTGVLTDPSKPATRRPLWGDFSSVPDPIQRANILIEAQASWEALPKALKDRFSSPEELIEFVYDDKNRAEAEKLGLIIAKGAKAPTPEPAPAQPDGEPAEPTPEAKA